MCLRESFFKNTTLPAQPLLGSFAGVLKHLHHAGEGGEGHELAGAFAHGHPAMPLGVRVRQIDNLRITIDLFHNCLPLRAQVMEEE